LQLETTPDIVAEAGRLKRPDQRTVGFSLETAADEDRVRGKMRQKNLDLIVYNPMQTVSSDSIEPILFYPDGRVEKLPSRGKAEFADILLQRAAELFRVKSL